MNDLVSPSGTASHSDPERVPWNPPAGSGKTAMIEITHSKSDPGTWIVRQYAKRLWFRKRISSTWFNSEQQAIAFAQTLQIR